MLDGSSLLDDRDCEVWTLGIRRAASNWGLTPRQAQVLGLLVLGLANKEVASTLCCSEVTVEFHMTRLLVRARASSRGRLTAAFWLGISR